MNKMRNIFTEVKNLSKSDCLLLDCQKLSKNDYTIVFC